jgi:hypothetical protein
MKHDIERLTVFSPVVTDNWVFRCSISDAKNIMLIAFCKDTSIKNTMLIRFFTDPELAGAFVDECAAGKHQE